MGEAARQLEDLEAELEDNPYDDTWHAYTGDKNLIWNPEQEVNEDPILLSRARRKAPKIPDLRPSQYTRAAFWMPDEEGGLGEDGMGYNHFKFEGRRHLIRIYDSPVKRRLLICGRQVEKSTMLGNLALCYMSLVPAFRLLYVSPSATQTTTFSNDRIKEPIETSPILRRFTTQMLSANILEKQFINRSKITLRYAFLNADRTRGIPADMLEIDEFQDVLGDNIPVIEQCLAHGRPKWRIYLYAGTPKSLDNNIEYLRANSSTQGEWVVPCDACGVKSGPQRSRHWNILGERNIGKKGLICEKCGTLLNAAHPDAAWMAQVAWDPVKVPFESYRISQLMVPWKPWEEVLIQYQKYPRDKFYNEVLGLSYDSGLRPLTRAQVMACCRQDLSMQNIENYRQLGYSQPIFAGIDWGCHDEDTRVLTRDGFKYFRDLEDEDEVAQWEPDTRRMTFVKPKARTVRNWDQPLLHFKTKGGVDMMVTHTHRMRVGVSQGERWLTESAGELVERGGNVNFVGRVEWDGGSVDHFTLPGLPKSPGYSGCEPRVFRMDDWLEFFGYVVTEGGVCLRENAKGEDAPYCVKMSQRETVNPQHYQKIQDCLTRLGIPHSAFPNPKTGDVNWAIYGKQFWKWFAENMGVHAENKRVPREFFLTAGRRGLRVLFEAMVLGDGYVDPRGGCTGGAYYSTSKGLCEDFQEICIRLGLRCVVRLHKPAEGNRKARWRALWSAGRDYAFNTPSTKVKRVPYKGKVYCCAVPSGYIVTERNGCVSYQGNTGENAYTVLTLATYINDKFRVFFWHRFVGEEIDPEVQIAHIIELLEFFNVRVVGTDYGGGFDRNHKLVRKFGPNRVFTYQYMARTHKRIWWDRKMIPPRFKLARTEVMSDIFNAIKRHQCEFPRWEEFMDPYAMDMTNIFSEYSNTLRAIQYGHSKDKPDDSFHSLLYCWLVSMMLIPRRDIIAPGLEIDGKQVEMYSGPIDQG